MLSSNTSAVSGDATYIEDVFSTYLYTGNGSTQTITNNIDLSTKGGLVWIKNRQNGSAANVLFDTARGAKKRLISESSGAEYTYASTSLTAFGSSGFTVVDNSAGADNVNGSPGGTYAGANGLYASWSFRKQPKFFDVVTYTGNGSTGGQTISHNLGSTPGCIIVKHTSGGNNWRVYHRSKGVAAYAALNLTDPFNSDANNPWKTPTDTTFGVGDGVYWSSLNQSGQTYVAYLFAHDAGGFGLTGSDNVISCGSFTWSGGTDVNLGYEPQFILWKDSTGVDNWRVFDNMRGWTAENDSSVAARSLYPNLTTAEQDQNTGLYIKPTGFGIASGAGGGASCIYIAIRRGPMKTPTNATQVFKPVQVTTSITPATITTGFPVDMVWTARTLADPVGYKVIMDRLRGSTQTSTVRALQTNSTNTESSSANGDGFDSNVSIIDNYWWNQTSVNGITINHCFRRAPGFFDEVCYAGTGVAKTVTHNLGVVPELMIVKGMNAVSDWTVYDAASGATKAMYMNSTAASAVNSGTWNNTTPTSTVFSIGNGGNTNEVNKNFVAYLFATLAGISKVGSYTGNGSSQTINCGFAAGARFILIKRSNSTGDWYTWNSTRGIVAGNDPHMSFNTTGAEVTNNDSIDPDSSGFIVNQLAATNINVNAATYIYLAIA